MLERYFIDFIKSNRKICIDVYYNEINKNEKYDTLYILDGQNAFYDSYAAFGRAVRINEHIDYLKQYNKNILAVAIHNSGSDMGRVNEYSPFKVINSKINYWYNNDVNICHNFCDDLINILIPFINKIYKTSNKKMIYGSSLAAVTALYLGFNYNEFKYIGAFSTASFLFGDAFYNFLENKPKRNVFLYVGRNEVSEALKDINLYYNTSINLYNYFKNNKINTKLLISKEGKHNEETWDNNFLEFLSFVYDNNLIIKK